MTDNDLTLEKDILADSQSEKEPADLLNDDEGAKEKSPAPTVTKKSEEVQAWESLSGGTQDRIKQLLRERDEWKQKAAAQAENDLRTVSNNVSTQDGDDEVQKAVQKLSPYMPTKADVKEEISNIMQQFRAERLHDKLEEKYNGDDGLPKYDRQEVWDFAVKNGFGNLEMAYKSMYFDEFVDAAKRKRGTSTSIMSEKPTASQPKETLTMDSLRKKLAGPDGRKVYDKLMKNPAQFDALMKQLAE